MTRLLVGDTLGPTCPVVLTPSSGGSSGAGDVLPVLGLEAEHEVVRLCWSGSQRAWRGAVVRVAATRRVYFHDPEAPPATTVAPSAFAAARAPNGRLLLVRRCDSGTWELPGGRVDIGESAVDTAVRETCEEAGVAIRITGLVGLYTDPAEIVCSVDGEVRQQFVVVFHAEAIGSIGPHPDGLETSEAAWVDPDDVDRLAIEPAMRIRIAHALSSREAPHLGLALLSGRALHGRPGEAWAPDRLSGPAAPNRNAMRGDGVAGPSPTRVLDHKAIPAPPAQSPIAWGNHLVDLIRHEVHDATDRGTLSLAEAEQLLARIVLVADQSLSAE